MLQNAYLVAKIGADTAENEQHFAEILPKISNYPPPPRPSGPPPPGARRRPQAVASPYSAQPLAATIPLIAQRWSFFSKAQQNSARFRLYRHQFLLLNTIIHFAFFGSTEASCSRGDPNMHATKCSATPSVRSCCARKDARDCRPRLGPVRPFPGFSVKTSGRCLAAKTAPNRASSAASAFESYRRILIYHIRTYLKTVFDRREFRKTSNFV